MKNIRNKNQPVNADLVQVYLQSSWDIVTAVYAELANIQTVADAITSGSLDQFLTTADIDTLAELNAILTDAVLGDAGDFATAAQGAKVDLITVTAPTDLDQLSARINDLDAAVVLRGSWDASAGTFPGGGTAQAGDSWIVDTAGTVDGVDFQVDDRIIALTDNASTTVFLANWHKADYSDIVTSVAGLTGAVGATALRGALNVEDGATADQTGAEIKTLYEAQADTNAFTDNLLTKLTNIEALADVTDATNVNAAGAVMHSDITPTEGLLQKTAAESYTAIKTNLAASTDPGVGNDSSQGYGKYSPWINTTGPTLWICLDPSVGAAVWQEVGAGGGGGGGMTVTSVKTGNYTAGANEVVPVDSSAGSFTITAPSAPAAQSRLIVIDVGWACTTYPVTVARNGATLNGVAEDFVINQSHGRWDGSYASGNWSAHLVGTVETINVNDFATGFAGVNAQTGTSYGFVSTDLTLLVTANNGSASSYTIPDGLAQIGETLNILNIGAGTVTVTVPGTDTITSTANDVTAGKAATLVKITATSWFLIGGV